MIEKHRFIFEKHGDLYEVYLHPADLEKLDCASTRSMQEGRGWIGDFEANVFQPLFPRIAKSLKDGESIEVELSIRTIGAALPWKEWTWQ